MHCTYVKCLNLEAVVFRMLWCAETQLTFKRLFMTKVYTIAVHPTDQKGVWCDWTRESQICTACSHGHSVERSYSSHWDLIAPCCFKQHKTCTELLCVFITSLLCHLVIPNWGACAKVITCSWGGFKLSPSVCSPGYKLISSSRNHWYGLFPRMHPYMHLYYTHTWYGVIPL